MMNRKTAFTLTEIIIVLVILGALALILVPNMSRMMPDDHNIKYKKAFYTIQEIVNDIVNDPSVCQGMNNDGAGNWTTPPNEARQNNILTMCYDGNAGRNLDVLICERLSTNQNCGAAGANTNILTTNGMRWNLPNRSLRDTNNANWATPAIIYVDVDGGSAAPGNNRNSNNGVYRIFVTADGRVQAPNNNLKQFAGTADDTSTTTEQSLLIDNPTE